MPIPSTGEIKLNDDINATLQADTNEQDVSLKDNNAIKFAAVADGDTISGRSMSELRGQTLFQIFPTTEETGMVGESLHMDGITSNHNSVKIFEPATTAAPAFEATRGTFSFWVKIHETDSDSYYFYTSGASSSSDLIGLKLHSSGTDHKFVVRIGTNYWYTESIFLDKTGWYNFVVAIDTNIISGDEQVKVYANGLPLIFSDTATLTVGTTVDFGTKQRINDWAFSAGYGVDATYGNFIFVDGNALLPNEFGELNYGIWVPKEVNKPSTDTLITTNLTANYDFVHGSIQDTSGNGNHLTKTGTGGTASQSNYGIWTTPGSTSSFLNMPDIINSHSTTISMWVHPKNLTSTEYFFHATKEIYGIWDITAGKYNVYFGGAGYVIQNMPAQDKWTMLTLTTTGPRDVQFYIDGNLVNTITTGSDLQQDYNYYSNTLGYTHHTATPNSGEMAFGEIQIYSTGLTAAQVLQNFNATKYKYFYGRHGWHFNFNNTDQGSIVSGSVINLDAGDWDADGTDETSFSGTTWSDKSGNNHHATLTNGPAYSSDNGGYFLFDGSDDFATITSNSSFQSLADFSLEMWIYPVSVGDDEMINLLYTSGSNYKWDLRFSSGSSRNFRWGVASSSGGYASAQDLTTNTNTGAVDLNKWSHVVATFSSTFGVMSVYINGSLTDTKTGTFTTRTNGSENLLLAKRTDGYQANIGIAQSRVYSKALTPTEVVQNFRATQGHYNVLSLADISSNAKYASNNGSNLSAEDHSQEKLEDAYPNMIHYPGVFGFSSIGNKIHKDSGRHLRGNNGGFISDVCVNTGKWYWEIEHKVANTYFPYIGVTSNPESSYNSGGEVSTVVNAGSASKYGQNSNAALSSPDASFVTSGSSSVTAGTIIGLKLDLDAGNFYFLVNNVVKMTDTGLPSDGSKFFHALVGFTNAGTGVFWNEVYVNFGQKEFSYAVPSGYKTLASSNLPTATNVDPLNKKKPTDYFKTVLYTGNNGFQKIRGLGFDPDFVWLKNRDGGGYHHDLYDTVRGDNLRVFSSQTSSEATGYLQFKTDGFNLTSGGGGNTLNNEHAAWCWKAGGKAVSNTAGTGITSSVSASSTGFSIVKWTTTTTGTHTVGHGLNVNGVATKPSLMMLKNISNGSTNWFVYTDLIDGSMDFFYLNASNGKANSSLGVPTTTTFQQGNLGGVSAGNTGLAYLFASVPGFQKIGTYSGNGNSNGPTIYTGFRPAWILIKRSDTTANWRILDNKRSSTNTRDDELYPNLTNAEGDYDAVNFLSNGFEIVNTDSSYNTDGGNYLYMAIAEDPAKYSQGDGAVSDIEMFLDAKGAETSYPDNNFKAVNWTGTGYINFIDDVGFKPDFVWTNARSFGNYSQLFDSIRGVTKELEADTNSGEATNADSLTNFANNGFVLGTSNNENQNTSTYKAWCWKAGDTQVTKKPTYTSAGILTSNLVLHYNFADSNTYAGTGTTIYDLTSNDNDGTLVNDPTWIDRANGNYFKFDGSNDYINSGLSTALGTGDFSIECWIHQDNEDNWNMVYGDQYYSSTGGYGIGYYIRNGYFAVWGEGTNGTPYKILAYDDPHSVRMTANKWNHLVVTRSDGTFKGYINGVLAITNTSSSLDQNYSATDAYIMRHYNVSDYYIAGNLGQFRIYTAELTQSQIRANYDATRTLYQGVGTTGNVLQTGLLNNIDVDSFDAYDPSQFGADNKVAKFSANGAIDLPATIDDPMRSASAFAISVWYKHETQTNSYGGKLIVFLNNIYNFIQINTNGTWYARVANSSNTSTEIEGLHTLAVGTWYHFVWTGNASNGCTLYCNGVKQGNGAWDGTFMTYTDSNYLFNKIGYQGSTVGYLKGSVDMVRLYNTEVTNAEVKALFHETSATTGTLNPSSPSGFPSGCYAAYNFNSDSGSTVNDLSDNYDATASNVSFEVDGAVTGWMVKDLTSNKHDLGGFYNATINRANNWGRSIKFDGTGDFVSLPVGLGRTDTQDVTRELWVKVDDYPAGGSPDGILYIGDMTEDGYYEFLRVFSDGSLGYMERNTNNAGGHNISFATDIGNTMLSENVWYHIAYTISGGTKKLYINGKIQVSKIFTDTKVNNSAYGGSLGAFRGSANATFHGEIAQFRSYTSALTDAQVKANFDATKAQFYSPLIHSTVSVNNKAGFSVVKYTGEGNETDIISHGQSSAPDFIITKRYDASGQNWNIRTPFSKNQANSLSFPIGSNDKTLSFNSTTGYADYTMDAQTNTAGGEYISYCFRDIPGYMKFGQYVGNGSTTGPRIYTGFRPRFIVTKHTSGSDAWKRWYFSDSATGIGKTTLYPNFTSGEGNYNNFNIFNDGFQIKVTDGTINQSGYTFFYWAIA